MSEPAIECGSLRVADLLTFVAARAEEDRCRALLASPTNGPLIETCDIVEGVLLDMAREACRADEPCSLPGSCLRALGEYASLHESHPDFHPAWSGWRLLRPPGT